MKNKKLLWILVVAILVVSSSSVIALSPLDALGAALKGGGRSVAALIANSVIIFLLLKLLSKITQFPKLEDHGNKRLFAIALAILSVYLALNINIDKPSPHYIWEKEVIGNEVGPYFFGKEVGKEGILIPGRILIFAGASLLFSWFFVGFLQIGGKEHSRIDYFLAMLIAAEITRAGISKGMLIFVGQVIALFMLYDQFSKKEKRHRLVAFIWAYVIQSLIVRALFRPADRIWASWFLTWVWIPNSFIGLIRFILVLLVILPLAVAGLKWRGKKEGIARYRSDVKWYGGHFLRDIARKLPILKRFQYRNTAPERELPFEFRNMKLELAILMEYMLRLDVYNIKSGFVNEARQEAVKDQEGTPDKKGYRDIREAGKQKGDAYEYKVGARSIQDSNSSEWSLGSYKLKTTEKDGKVATRHIKNIGWANHRDLIFSVMNHLRDTLINSKRLKTEPLGDVKAFTAGILTGSVGIKIGNFNARLDKDPNAEEVALMNAFFKKFMSNIGFYGLTQKRDSNRWAVFDQNNINGNYRHTYKFARFGAKVKLVIVRVVENKETGAKFCKAAGESTGTYDKLPSGTYGLGTQLYEVNEEGLFVEDINSILNEKYPLTPNQKEYDCRKVDPPDVIDHGSFTDICEGILAEWNFFIKDVQIGMYHPYSRTAADYNICHHNKDFWYREMIKELGKVRRTPGGDYPAFDREALKDPTFVYRGKIKYTDLSEHEMETSPIKYPTISTKGLTSYIQGRLIEMEKLGNLDEYMGAWKWDKQETKKGGK